MNFLLVGTIANDVHFQCYLLEGIVRWNEDRASAAMIDGCDSPTSSYSSSLKCEINRLTKMVYGEDQQKNFDHPGKYTGNVGFVYLDHVLHGVR